MDSPVAVIKSQLSVGAIMKGAVGLIVLLALANLFGVTDYVLYPVDYVKAKFAKAKA